MADKPLPSLIIKKVKKSGHGHHGGAWKVAFADFAVAMMAFFLVLWLTANTTPQEKQEISGFFLDPDKYKPILSTGGSFIDASNNKKQASNNGDNINTGLKLKVVDTPGSVEYEKEKMRLDSLKMALGKKIEEDPIVREFKDQIILDSTSEGLRIQIVDDAQGAMFESGSTELRDKAIEVLKTLAKTINQVPNKIGITGHTDSKPFNAAGSNKTNWELSPERANAARRLLIENGLEEEKVARVVGVASTALFDAKNPEAATNRRISIIVLRKESEEEKSKEKALKASDEAAIKKTDLSKAIDPPKNPDLPKTLDPVKHEELPKHQDVPLPKNPTIPLPKKSEVSPPKHADVPLPKSAEPGKNPEPPKEPDHLPNNPESPKKLEPPDKIDLPKIELPKINLPKN